ncbi:MAG TPA: cupin domain-containing protein [candidate division Zixibacteria bacterium]|nr:cupin domain-containing protein [candidate division Zixibacteria bacterium]MDD4917606.1 cupin domain-containing protein [candidate division Zixibacteria bacterium]HOD67039.1 cupin domain-containing protein [candidate division Zixibacteria bacterium]HOZ08064.1 cupin domain-containing protein [candidate division Zixibacteria bacterium]HPI33135.1 cupin domain-containing protein [candidate division Zixibacteria bacterium]
MPVIKYSQVARPPVEGADIDGMTGGPVIGEDQGWKENVLRVFRLAPGGHSPRHQHAWEHVNYVIRGRGQLQIGETVHELAEKDFAFVPGEAMHQFSNPYDEDFEFICIIPNLNRPPY